MKAQVVSLVLCLSMFELTSCLLDGLQDARFQLLTQEIEQLKQTVAGLQAQLNAKGNNSGPIAFTASLSATVTLGTDQRIIFDRVLTNIGNGYSSLHGHLTAPVRGAYSFVVMLTSTASTSTTAALMRNGQHLAHLLAHGHSANDLYVTSTIAVNVQLEKADQVWVQHFLGSNGEKVDGYDWSLFSGNLIAEN